MTRTLSQKRRAAQRTATVNSRRRAPVTTVVERVVRPPPPPAIVRMTTVARRPRRNRPRVPNTNPYLMSLKDPENVIGVGIPDVTCIPTGKYQIQQRIVRIADNRGTLGLWCAPWINFGTFQTITASADTGGLTWSAPQQFVGSGGASNIYADYRVVSGCIKAVYIGNTSQDSGRLVGIWRKNTNPGVNATDNGVPLTETIALNAAYSTTVPVRNGLCVLYRPDDNGCFEFVINLAYGYRPVIGMIAVGMTPGSSIEFTCTFNYESVANADTASYIQMSATDHNQSWIDQASMWGQYLKDKAFPLFNTGGLPLQFQQAAGVAAIAGLTAGANRISQDAYRWNRGRRRMSPMLTY